MTYEEAVAYLDSFVNYERTYEPQAMRAVKLERMQRLCQRLGEPQRSFRSVLVAGTNGKGSICAMLYSMLRESTLRVGLYTSPHVEHLRERIRVWTSGPVVGERVYADDWIRERDFAAMMSELHPVLEAMRRELPDSPPTYFEVLTACAFLYFTRQGVEVAVLEVGLGGRLDATNVVEQAVSAMASIDVDHTEILGADLEAITREKAGIIKPRQEVITVPQTASVKEVLRDVCEANGVPLWVGGEDLTVSIQRHTFDGLQISLTGLRGVYSSLDLPLLGRHQAYNAACAVGALEALSNTGVPYTLVERGLALVEWPGRIEVVHDAPLVLMDGAHNPQAASALRATLEELAGDRKIHLLIGMSSDKLVEQLGERLAPLAESVTCSRSRHPRAMDPRALAKRVSPYCRDVRVVSEAADACTYLLNTCGSSDVIVVTGSLFLVGELRSTLRRAGVHPRRPTVAA